MNSTCSTFGRRDFLTAGMLLAAAAMLPGKAQAKPAGNKGAVVEFLRSVGAPRVNHGFVVWVPR